MKENDKCITQLVSKLDSIFTGPDKIYMQQEDQAHFDPAKNSGEN